MFNNTLIPSQDNQIKEHLTGIYAKSGANDDQIQTIDKRLSRVDQMIKDKIMNATTISEYFDKLWKQADIKEEDKETAITKLEAIQRTRILQIQNGEQEVAQTSANLDTFNANHKITPFEEFNLQERMKEVKKTKKLDIEIAPFAQQKADLDFLHALNKPLRTSQNSKHVEVLHYTAASIVVDENESLKQQKAEEFVKKIKGDKKAFAKKMRRIESSVENRELGELERIKQKQKEEEELRQKEKKDRLEANIKEMKARSEARFKEKERWDEDYRNYMNKKPLYKEIEEKYQKGYMIPELEERKKKLQEIRDFHRPIAKEELLQHEQKVLRSIEEQAMKKKEQSMLSAWTYKRPTYESKHHREFADELSKVRNQRETDQIEKLKRKEKVLELLKDVKEKYVPKADPQKELELLGLIEKLKNPNKKKENRSRTADEDDTFNDHNPRRLGNEYLKSVKELVQRKRLEIPRRSIDNSKEDAYEIRSERNRMDTKDTKTSLRSDNIPRRNYLAELRKENKLQSNTSQVDMIIKNKKLDVVEKKELLKSEVEKLEEKAKRKEMVIKLKDRRRDLGYNDEDEEVDQIYINAIKAKLELLGNN